MAEEDRCGAHGEIERRRGRPVQIAPERREALVLQATAELLEECSLSELTMASIARRAGMSKRTIYGMFDSRETLLETCFARLTRSFFRPLASTERDLPLSARLEILLTFNPGAWTKTYTLEILRAVIAETHTFPALARRVCEEGRGTLLRNVACELAVGAERGEIGLAEERIPLAASVLVDMAFQNPVPWLLTPDTPPATPEEIADRRTWAVALFLDGLAADNRRGSGSGQWK